MNFPRTPDQIIMHQFFSLDNLTKLCKNTAIFHTEFLPILARNKSNWFLVAQFLIIIERSLYLGLYTEFNHHEIMSTYAKYLHQQYIENTFNLESNPELVFFIYNYYFDNLANKNKT